MAFTELYVVDSGGAAQNGGSGTGSPTYTCADSTVAASPGLTIIVDNVASWTGVQVGEWLTWDTAGVKEWRRVTSISGNQLTVDRAMTAGANKNTIVGGAWDKPSSAAAKLNTQAAATWPSAVASAPPRLNIAVGNTVATPYSETGASVTFSATWSAAIPLFVSGGTDGTSIWHTTESRPVTDFGSSGGYGFNITGAYTFLYNLKAIGGRAGVQYLFQGQTGVPVFLFNCLASFATSTNSGNTGFRLLQAHKLFRCEAVFQAASAAGIGFEIAGAEVVAIGCVSRGTGSNTAFKCGVARSVYTNCIAHDSSIGFSCTGDNQTLLNCTAANCTSGVSFGSASNQATAVVINSKLGHNTNGVAGQTGYAPGVVFNEFYTNTNNVTNGTFPSIGNKPNADPTDASNQVQMFNDQANDDYRPYATTSAYSGNDAGFPGELAPGGDAWTGCVDMGALGRAHSGGSVIIIED